MRIFKLYPEFIISLIMMFSVVGCADNNTNSLPIIPDSSNVTEDTDEDLKEESSGNSTETEDNESSENDGNLGEDDDSSSNENVNKPSSETDGWTGFY